MGCFVVLFAFFSPRLALIVLWLFGDLLGRAYDASIVPILGFFLLPWTTLAYAAFWDWGTGSHATGVEWFFVVLAFLADIGAVGGGRREQDRRRD